MKYKKENNTLWLCLRFTHLSLNSLSIALDNEQAYAVNVRNKVYQCNTSAELFGIRKGISISHALMLHAELRLVERDIFAEQQRLQKLCDWAYRYSSMVVKHNDHSLLLEIGESIILFNSLKRLFNLIQHDLYDMQMSICSGVSHTPKSAYALSFSSPSKALSTPLSIPLSNEPSKQNSNASLAIIKIRNLEISEKTKAKLHHCGFSNLGDLQSINRAELGQRFGQELLNYLDQLEGKKADPQTTIRPTKKFESCLDFAQPITNLHWIEQQIERLLSDLYIFITKRELFCRSFTWRFFHENNHLLDTVHIELSSKNNSLDSMLELSQLRLSQLNLKWEFSSIELSSHHLSLKKLFDDDLFDPQPDLEQFNQLIDKLSNRLGHTALFRLNHCNEQLPEMANTRQHIHDSNGHKHSLNGILKEDRTHYLKNKTINAKNTLRNQPLWLLEKPKYLVKKGNKPIYKGALNIINGPKRISSHWWSKLQSRDYYLARQTNGRLLWIYFDREQRNWYLHGLFS